MGVELLHIDCMEYMKGLPDKAFDLAIVDPPYGIGVANMNLGNGVGTKSRTWEIKNWDKEVPTHKYFDELFRVSKNQIVWGANYMLGSILPSIPFLSNINSPCWLIWDKIQEFSGADFELAWTSFETPSKAFRMSRVEAYTKQLKIHPTQKPIKLYRWLLHNYAKEGDTILDTHLGSGSSAIAAHQMGFDFVGCELDKDYYDAACKRFKEQTAQQDMFR